jgi:phosphatidylglycerophosphatase A
VNTPRAISTLLGVGYSRYAPGTVASAVALPLAYLIAYFGNRFILLLCAIAALAVGAWASELYAAETKTFDPSECVVDELAGQWIACAFAPVSLVGFALAFVLFRLFDICKPWPIRHTEGWHGGLGIMADDVVAAVMGGIILVVLSRTGLI